MAARETGKCTCGTPALGTYRGPKNTRRDFKPDPHLTPTGDPCPVNPMVQKQLPEEVAPAIPEVSNED